jgi:hypothetical protein
MMLGTQAMAQQKSSSEAKKEAKTTKKTKKTKKAKKKTKARKVKKDRTPKKRRAASNSGISIVDAKTTSEVKEREPIGASTSFSKGSPVTVWMAVRNPEGPSTVKLVYMKDDKEVATTDVDVGKSWRWRTWATRTISAPGSWKVEIRDEDGASLKTLEFTVN